MKVHVSGVNTKPSRSSTTGREANHSVPGSTGSFRHGSCFFFFLVMAADFTAKEITALRSSEPSVHEEPSPPYLPPQGCALLPSPVMFGVVPQGALTLAANSSLIQDVLTLTSAVSRVPADRYSADHGARKSSVPRPGRLEREGVPLRGQTPQVGGQESGRSKLGGREIMEYI